MPISPATIFHMMPSTTFVKLSRRIDLAGHPDLTDRMDRLAAPMMTLCHGTDSPEGREKVMDAKAVWHFGKDGGPSPAIWKSVVDGKTCYARNTHGTYQDRRSLDAAIRISRDFIKDTT